MEKEFIPYSEALALKELGFNEPCFGYYNEKLELWGVNPSSFHAKNSDVSWNCKLSNIFNKSAKLKLCTAPLYQQVFRWFREKYNLESHVKKDWTDGILHGYESIIECLDGYIDVGTFKTYEEAELECLKKLIEIIKNK